MVLPEAWYHAKELVGNVKHSSFPRKGLLKNLVLSQTVGATLRGCPVFMPTFRVGTETYPLHSALFQQPRKRESIFLLQKSWLAHF